MPTIKGRYTATPLSRLLAPIGKLHFFLPALLVFTLAATSTHPLTLALLLLANALVMSAACQSLGFGLELNFARNLLRRGVAFLVLLVVYTATVALLVTYPLLVLIRDGSLGATIALTCALVAALLSLWRIWPVFGLVFVWDDAYPAANERSWIFAAIARSLTFATHLTAEHELFFSHGLIVALSLLTLALGALSLAGLGGVLPSEFHIVALGLYALALVPLANFLIVNRCIRALLLETQTVRTDPAPAADQNGGVPAKPILTKTLTTNELNAMLLRATRSGETELALAALERGADPYVNPEPSDRDQRPLLVVAATNSDLRLLRALIAKGIDINRAQAGLTPLLAATRDSYQGRPDVVMTLVTNGADPRTMDAEHNTALHYAALSSDATIAALLLDANAPLHAVNREGLTPLGVACSAANWPLVQFLLERGAKLEVEHAQPALIAAASIADDDPAGVKLLIKRKAKMDARGPLGRSALMAAALQGHVEIARALLAAGANVDAADSHGTTALMEAARAGAHEVIALIAEYHPSPNLIDNTGRSALIIACQSRQATDECVRALLALGADPRQAAGDGKTAFDFALNGGRWNLVALLDPSYVLPASVSTAPANLGSESASAQAHLLDALRFDNTEVMAQFSSQARDWPQPVLMNLYLDLLGPEQSAARTWLLNHGLNSNARDSANKALFTELLGRLPHALSALDDLIHAGANVAGAGVLIRLLKAHTAEFTAAQHAQLEKLALYLIECGADFLSCDENKHTTLHLATEHAMAALACALIARGCDPNARDLNGRTPLHNALGLSLPLALKIVPKLIAAGADPEAVAANNETPLGLAMARPDSEIKDWLRWSRWRLPQRALFSSDLPAAAMLGDAAAIDKLLVLGFAVDSTDAQGASALLRAAGSGHAELTKRLLNYGANAAHTALSGATALSAAVSARRENTVTALLDHGVTPDQPLPGGGTALMVAAALGYPEITAHLLARGAAVNAQDEKHTHALHAAALFAFQTNDTPRAKALIDLLLQHGASLNQPNDAGQTPLLLLLGASAKPGTKSDQKHLLAILPLLLSKGADLNAQDQRGVSALHACALHGLLLPARQLLAAGANPQCRDGLDRTPAELAQMLGYVDVATELAAVRPPALRPGAIQAKPSNP